MDPLLVRKLIHALTALVLVIGGGTVGYMLIEDWGFLDSLFFTLITITTVGYDDGGISRPGELFTILLVLFGIATATYGFSTIVQVAVSSQLAWRRKMQKKIDSLKNHYIVCGFGRVGRTVCEQLARENVDFVVVEKDPDTVQQAVDHGYLVIEGNATEDEVLQEARIEVAQGLVSVASHDADNIVIVLSATELNRYLFIMSRAEREESVRKIERAGAARVISPFRSSGMEIANSILRPHVAQFLRHTNHYNADFVLGEMAVEEGSPLVGRRISEFGQEESELVFVSLERGAEGVRLRPGGAEQFLTGDVYMVIGPKEAVMRVQKMAKETG